MVARLVQEHAVEGRHADHARQLQHAHVIGVPRARPPSTLPVDATQEHDLVLHASALEVGSEREDEAFGVEEQH